MIRNAAQVIPDAQEFIYHAKPWMAQSACAALDNSDRDLFFCADTAAMAKEVCAVCPVAWECLSYAADIDATHGVWGGLGEKERLVFLQRHLWRLDESAQADHRRHVTQLNRNLQKKRKS